MEENVCSPATNGLKRKKRGNSQNRLQFTVSVGTGFGDLILSLKMAEDTCVSDGIQTHNLSFHVAEDLSS
jgi:hypothetical protein